MRRVLFVIGAIISLTVGAPGAQQQPAPAPTAGQPARPGGTQPPPPVTFKTEVNYVEVDALVTNAQGDFVPGLTKDDFEVLEDGKPQKIEMFTEMNIPVEKPQRFLYSQRVIPDDTKTNRDPFQGRLYIIVLDDLHTNALRSALVKRAAHQFIDKNFGENDLAAIVTTSGQGNAAQEFTNDTKLLNRAIDKFIGQKLRSRTLERLDEYNRQRSMATPSTDENSSSSSSQQKILDPLDFERGYKARQTLSTLKNLSNYLSGVRGRRKALLFFSEGIDYPIYDIFDSRSASDVLYETREAITAAARSNVNFYTIDPQGLIGLPGDAIDITSVPEDNNLRLNTQGMMDEVRLSQDSLRTLAEETGGLAMVNQNDFSKGFDNIVRANSRYYVLGYYPSADQKRDGRFHKISVRTKQPGLKVNARKGYAAPKGKAPEEREKGGDSKTSNALKETLNSPLQTSGVGLTVAAAAFKGSAPNNSIAMTIEIDPTRMTFKEEKGLYLNKLELSFFPVDDKGKPLKGTTSELDLKLKPNTYQAIQAFGFRVNPRIELPPGRYQVRIGARESGANEVGSVFYDLEVPDFTKDKLSMSDVLLTAATSKLVMTPLPDKQAEGVLPLPATSRRDFVKGDVLALFAEVYDNLPALPQHKIDITTKLITEDGREVFKTSEERDSKDLGGTKGGGYGHQLQIPLADIAPGRYLLRIEAAARLKDVDPVSKELLIRVHQGRQAPAAPPAGAPPAGAQPTGAPGQKPGATPPATQKPGGGDK